jgi:pimeloyl-ACP methyl ester carboxylesterase
MKMSKQILGRRSSAILATAALVVATLVALPGAANAAVPQCATAGGVTSCQGATTDGAPYVMSAPLNFNGTVYLYSHGYRFAVDIPAGIPGIGGYKVTQTPQPVPNADVAKGLLAQGYGIAGSGFAKQGWNADSAVATDVELIGVFKTQFPTTKHVVAWGESLGGFITQLLAEKYPSLVTAAAPMCAVTNSIEQQMTIATDVVWGFQTLFDPSIVGHGYAPGIAGYAQAMGDLGKIFTVLGKLKAGILTGAWPDTAANSPFGAALSGAKIPSRSALLLIGLMAGLPAQSAHFDGTTGPGDPNDPRNTSYDSFALAISPALAVLENVATAAALGVVARLDLEQQVGGQFGDNTKTDYAAQLGDAGATYNLGLSGDTATNAMLGALAQAPRWSAAATALSNLRALGHQSGTINVPTVTMHTQADPAVAAGNDQWLIDKYNASYTSLVAANIAKAKAAAKKAKKTKTKTKYSYAAPERKLLSFFTVPPEHYTQFTAVGAPDTSGPAANGTNHCNFSYAQYLSTAFFVGYAAEHGGFPDSAVVTFLREATPGFSFDAEYRAPGMKVYG